MYPVPNQNTMNLIRYLVIIANCCDFKNCILSITKIIMNQNLINSLVKRHSGQKKVQRKQQKPIFIDTNFDSDPLQVLGMTFNAVVVFYLASKVEFKIAINILKGPFEGLLNGYLGTNSY